MNREHLQAAVDAVRRAWPEVAPDGGMILGSGWSEVAEAFPIVDALPYADIPGLGAVRVAGHAGRLLWADVQGASILIFQGRRHGYEGEGWTPVATPVFILRALSAPVPGACALLLTNAAGGIHERLQPGDLMIIEDHINAMFTNPLIGAHDPEWGPRFPDQSQVYDPGLCDLLARAAGNGPPLHRGVYLATSGPAYETPAEVRAYRCLGADAVGMSTVPEATLGRAAGLRVAGLSCITNRAAGLSSAPLTHEEVTETARRAMVRMTAVVQGFWRGWRNESS
jgi:purine-nucleoside phosphorylase